MTRQAETQKTGKIAVRRQEQLGVSSSKEHKSFDKASRCGQSRAATGRGAGRAGCRLARARRRSRTAPQRQAPPHMLTGQSIRACLRREVPADHEAHSQSFGGAAARRPKRNEHADHDRHTLRWSERADSRGVATWESRAGIDQAEHARHGRIRTQVGHLSRMTSARGNQSSQALESRSHPHAGPQ